MFALAAALALSAPVPKPGPDWVTVKGTVVWPEKEKIPETKAYEVPARMSDANYAARGGPFIDDKFVIDQKTRGLKNVVVWLRPDDDDVKAKFPAERVHPDLVKAEPTTHALATEFCRFDKRVMAARVGDKIEVTNKSPVGCNFKWDDGDSGGCNVILQPNDKPFVTNALTTAGVGDFSDSIHKWYSTEERLFDGRVWVFDHPYFAVTNEDGEFEIKQVPRGKWRIVYRHESGYHKSRDGRLGFKVDMTANRDGVMTMKPVEFEGPKK